MIDYLVRRQLLLLYLFLNRLSRMTRTLVSASPSSSPSLAASCVPRSLRLEPIVLTLALQDFSGQGQTCNDGEVQDFIRTTTAFMDKTPWIVSYMYFGSFTKDDPAGGVPASSALFNDDGTFTAVGKTYIS